jgi:transposase
LEDVLKVSESVKKLISIKLSLNIQHWRAMSKAYPSNLTRDPYAFLKDLLPDVKSGDRPRWVDLWEVLNAIFYLLVAGVRWRSLPGDFPAWQTGYSYFRTWHQDGTWVEIHGCLRDWTRIEAARHPSPSAAIIDSHSVKSAAMGSQAVGVDAGKKIKGRKRFMTVDTLGLVLRVLVTSAKVPEREGTKQVLKQVNQVGKSVSRLHPSWADGGFGGEPFLHWVMACCRWVLQGVPRPEQTQGFV